MIRSPTGVSSTCRLFRSMSVTPRNSSSLRICVDRVGWNVAGLRRTPEVAVLGDGDEVLL